MLFMYFGTCKFIINCLPASTWNWK